MPMSPDVLFVLVPSPRHSTSGLRDYSDRGFFHHSSSTSVISFIWRDLNGRVDTNSWAGVSRDSIDRAYRGSWLPTKKVPNNTQWSLWWRWMYYERLRTLQEGTCSLCFSTTSGTAGRLYFLYSRPYVSCAWKTVIPSFKLPRLIVTRT